MWRVNDREALGSQMGEKNGEKTSFFLWDGTAKMARVLPDWPSDHGSESP